MNRQNKVKRAIILAIVIACLIAIIGGTYARYTSSGTASASAQVAKWHVTLNGTDISTETKTVNVPLTYDENNITDEMKPLIDISFNLT